MRKEELFRNKLHIESPTSISLGYNTWYNLDTKLVGRVKKMIDENQQLKNRINDAIDLIKELACYEQDTHTYCRDIIYYDVQKIVDELKGKSE